MTRRTFWIAAAIIVLLAAGAAWWRYGRGVPVITATAGRGTAVEIVYAGQTLTQDQLATLNKAVNDNEEPFTQFRKRLPTFPGINTRQTEGKLGRPAFPSEDENPTLRVPEKN